MNTHICIYIYIYTYDFLYTYLFLPVHIYIYYTYTHTLFLPLATSDLRLILLGAQATNPPKRGRIPPATGGACCRSRKVCQHLSATQGSSIPGRFPERDDPEDSQKHGDSRR